MILHELLILQRYESGFQSEAPNKQTYVLHHGCGNYDAEHLLRIINQSYM